MWSTFRDALDAAPRDFSWAVSSHDDPRAPTRLGGGELGQSRALAYCVMMFALPGLPFLYQGDELGLADVDVPLDRCQDPVAVRNRNPSNGRDGCRTPMPWAPGPEAGFTDGADPWLPVGRNDSDTAAAQRDDPQAILHKYRDLLALRRELPDLHAGGLEWLTDRTNPVISFRRGDTVCALNTGDVPTDLRLPPGQWRLAFSSQQPAGAMAESALSLDAPEGVLLARVPDSA